MPSWRVIPVEVRPLVLVGQRFIDRVQLILRVMRGARSFYLDYFDYLPEFGAYQWQKLPHYYYDRPDERAAAAAMLNRLGFDGVKVLMDMRQLPTGKVMRAESRIFMGVLLDQGGRRRGLTIFTKPAKGRRSLFVLDTLYSVDTLIHLSPKRTRQVPVLHWDKHSNTKLWLEDARKSTDRKPLDSETMNTLIERLEQRGFSANTINEASHTGVAAWLSNQIPN